MSPPLKSDLGLVIAALATFAAVSVWGNPWLAAPAAALIGLGWFRGGPTGFATIVFALVALFYTTLFSLIGWPLVILIPIGISGVVGWRFERVRPASASFSPGKLSWGWIAAFTAASTIGLLAWVYFLEPDLERYREYVPDLPLPLLLVGALLFPVANALIEEGMYRGVLQRALEQRFAASGWLFPVLAQAIIFGLAHWRGFPSGPVGALLAGSWGFGLGLLRRHTGGLLSPLIAHVAADFVIFVVVLIVARG